MTPPSCRSPTSRAADRIGGAGHDHRSGLLLDGHAGHPRRVPPRCPPPSPGRRAAASPAAGRAVARSAARPSATARAAPDCSAPSRRRPSGWGSRATRRRTALDDAGTGLRGAGRRRVVGGSAGGRDDQQDGSDHGDRRPAPAGPARGSDHDARPGLPPRRPTGRGARATEPRRRRHRSATRRTRPRTRDGRTRPGHMSPIVGARARTGNRGRTAPPGAPTAVPVSNGPAISVGPSSSERCRPCPRSAAAAHR